MALISEPEILRVFLSLAGFLVGNFISIHTMANLILYEGSSREKSLRISAELALLSATYVFLALLLWNFIGVETVSLMVIAAIALSYGLFIEVFRIWYIRREYDTTFLYAFMIGEGLMLLLYLLAGVFRNALLV